ncbi:Clavaminate synthase-like protein [Myriangium duriaei CBS 260.36]|uniref:Clavaminate synthase-like protein n=1 Tax=Myriangium duriaei CBS 260.36 TaxID=1168546 RepID=A0A9P4J9J7_9PEZI|nr:Clavaminate synthase-like protein [Myriangium duriaei CBS 260.36]
MGDTIAKVTQALESLLENYHELNPAHIDELHEEPTPLQFMRYVARNRPFVIRGGAKDWKAFKSWDAKYLLEAMGDSPVNVAITPNGLADAVLDTPDGEKIFVEPFEHDEPFATVFNYITARGRGEITGPVKYCQTQNDNLRGEYDRLFSDVPQSIAFAHVALEKDPDAVNFWLGDEASITALHKDNYENIYAQIRGRKHFILMPPVITPCTHEQSLPYAKYEKVDGSNTPDPPYGLLPTVQQPVQHVPVPTWDPLHDLEPPNALGKHVKPLRVDLNEGDMMYLPAMWYHHVRQSGGKEGFSCSVNYWYDMDFAGQFWSTNSLVRDLSLLSAQKERSNTQP